jgi:hypothetical protein
LSLVGEKEESSLDKGDKSEDEFVLRDDGFFESD